VTTAVTERNPIKVARNLRRRIKRGINDGKLLNAMHIESTSFDSLNSVGKTLVRLKLIGYAPTVIRYDTPIQPLRVAWDEDRLKFVVLTNS